MSSISGPSMPNWCGKRVRVINTPRQTHSKPKLAVIDSQNVLFGKVGFCASELDAERDNVVVCFHWLSEVWPKRETASDHVVLECPALKLLVRRRKWVLRTQDLEFCPELPSKDDDALLLVYRTDKNPQEGKLGLLAKLLEQSFGETRVSFSGNDNAAFPQENLVPVYSAGQVSLPWNPRNAQSLCLHDATYSDTPTVDELNEFISAVDLGDLKAMTAFLSLFPQSVDASHGKDQMTSLMLASVKGNREQVQQLVFSGAKQDVKSATGYTALHYATASGNEEVVRFLMRYPGADVLGKDPIGVTPLHLAAGQEYTVLEALLKGSDISINVKDDQGWSPLHRAAYAGQLRNLIALLDIGGVDLEHRTGDGRTMLHLVLDGWDVESETRPKMVKLLLQSSQNLLNLTDGKGRTALHSISHCLDPTNENWMPHWEVLNRMKMVSVKADLKVVYKASGRRGALAAGCFLLANGADMTTKDETGQLPFAQLWTLPRANPLLNLLLTYAGIDCPDDKCLSCDEQFNDAQFHPCGHMLVCVSCWTGGKTVFKRCPKCSKPIESVFNWDGMVITQQQQATAKEPEIEQDPKYLQLQNRVEQLEQQMTNSDITCTICMVEPKRMAFQCGHMTCNGCGSHRNMYQCHICRETIRTRHQVYLT